MGLAAAILLGIVQGLTEFLPVSSSAHLILAREFFGWDLPPEFGLAFDVALHIGTLVALLVFFRRDVASMIAALPTALSADAGPPARLIRMIAAGMVPVLVVGLLFADYIEHALRTAGVAATALAIGAAVMFVAERVGAHERSEASLTWTDALLVGCAQASALVPGVSRSGSTIAIGMLLGLRRDAAARFTFLLAIPVMVAAAGKEGLELATMGVTGEQLRLMAVGAVVSAAVGYVTVKYFMRFLGRYPLDVFAYYRLALSVLTFWWLSR